MRAVTRSLAILLLLCVFFGVTHRAEAQAGATQYYTPDQTNPAATQAVTPAKPLPVYIPSGISVTTTPATTTTTIALTGTGTAILATNGSGTVGVSATGSGTGLTFSFQGYDGIQWITIQAAPINSGTVGAVVTSASANGNWIINSTPYQQTRVNLTAISGGTETFSLTGNPPSGFGINNNSATNPTYVAPVANGAAVSLTAPLPAAPPAVGALAQTASGTGFIQYKATAGNVYKVRVSGAPPAAYSSGTGYFFVYDAASPPGDGAVGPPATVGATGVIACAPINTDTVVTNIVSVEFNFNPPYAFANGLSVFFADAVTSTAASCKNKHTNDGLTTFSVEVQGN